MNDIALPRLQDRPRRSAPKIPSPIFAMLVFIATELMFFMALISAYTVIKAGAGNWVPPESIRLPLLATGFNTAVLLLSGVLFSVAAHKISKSQVSAARPLYFWSLILGGFFVAFQGSEWIKLMSLGMTMTSDVFSACFYLLIGCHGLHALGAVIGMGFQYRKFGNGTIASHNVRAMQMFWLFVVMLWPLLFGLVYF